MLLPNVLTDEVGLFKSFSPIFGYNKRDDDKESLFARIFIAFTIITTIIGCWLFFDYIYIIWEYIHYIYSSIQSWGYTKLEQFHSGGTQISYTSKHEEYMRRMGDI